MAQGRVQETGPTLPISLLVPPAQDQLLAALLPDVLPLLLGTLFLKVASTETHMATRLPVADHLVLLEEAVMADGLTESTSQDQPTHV